MRTLKFIFPILCVLLLQSCTHNDGDIGPYFGAWAMPSMTVDGETPEGFNPTATVWEFQSDLVRISLLDGFHEMADMSWGTWHEADGHLYLDYTHPSDIAEGSNGEYDAPRWLLIRPNSIADLTILEQTGRRMVLQYSTPDGQTVIYTLKKTW